MSTNLYDAFESYISQRIKGAPLHLRERRRGILYAKVSTPKEHITLQPVLKFNGDSVLLPCPLHEYTGHGTSKKALTANGVIKGLNHPTLVRASSRPKRLRIATMLNQDSLILLTLITGADILEHAFYL
ncbi:superoxide dismutase [Mn], mitochondrial [Mycena vulgaris]|nr:superoxide dismutase [Mn], mitochondrial [Mycena vulgaris]